MPSDNVPAQDSKKGGDADATSTYADTDTSSVWSHDPKLDKSGSSSKKNDSSSSSTSQNVMTPEKLAKYKKSESRPS